MRKKILEYSHKISSYYLVKASATCSATYCKEEVTTIISSLKSRKVFGLKSIPCRVVFPLKKLNFQSIDLFNHLFVTGVFSHVLKTTKVVPVLNKGSNLAYSNYPLMSPLLEIEKILEKRMPKILFTFLNGNN